MKESEAHAHEHTEKLRKVTVNLEEDQIELLREIAREYSEKLGQRWSVSAVTRVAVGDFLTKLGKIA